MNYTSETEIRRARANVRRALRDARTQALALIEECARAAMRANPKLHEFIMAMGTWFFVDATGKVIDGTPRNVRRLANIIDEFDGTLRLSGHPMRFTADGPVVTDW